MLPTKGAEVGRGSRLACFLAMTGCFKWGAMNVQVRMEPVGRLGARKDVLSLHGVWEFGADRSTRHGRRVLTGIGCGWAAEKLVAGLEGMSSQV